MRELFKALSELETRLMEQYRGHRIKSITKH